MSIVLIGYGNVGKEVKKILNSKNLNIDFVVEVAGVFDISKNIIDTNSNFDKYIDDKTIIFIATPSENGGGDSLNYYIKSLKKGAKIIACEKAVIAHHWKKLITYRDQIRYSATVGGDSGLLNVIRDFKDEIHEIRAVINGTLNYISDRFSSGGSKEEIFKEVYENKYIEPGSNNYDEVIETELEDVRLKSAILTNHSRLFNSIIKPEDIKVSRPKSHNDRCAVVIRDNEITSGFQTFKDTSWFPRSINNVLYINGQKVAEGPGAGSTITAERMYKDFKSF